MYNYRTDHKKDKEYIVFLIVILFSVGLIITAFMLWWGINKQPTINDSHILSASDKSNINKVPKFNEKAKLGLYLASPNIKTWATQLNGHLDIVAWFENWSDANFANNKLQAACSQGYVPFISWESWGGFNNKGLTYSLSDIASGIYDNYIRQTVKSINQDCPNQVVIIRFDHEMDMPNDRNTWYYPWQGDPSSYIAAWRHIVTITRSYSSRIKWLWSPMMSDQTNYAPYYYPGDSYIDYVGTTINASTGPGHYLDSFANIYKSKQSYLESFNKPVIIGEAGIAEANESYKDQWVSDMFNYIATNPKITAVVWFNSKIKDSAGSLQDYRINSSPQSLSTFKKYVNEFYKN